MKMLSGAALFLLAAIATAAGARVRVGTLPNLAHGVRGELFVDDDRTLSIDGFYYDGQGPDAFPYYYTVGEEPDRRGNGIIIPVPGQPQPGRFRRGRRYINENIVLVLPEGVTICEMSYFTIWCRAARQFFTQFKITEGVYSAFKCAPGGGTTPPPPTLQTSTIPIAMPLPTPTPSPQTSTMPSAMPLPTPTPTPEPPQPTAPPVDVELQNCVQLDPSLTLSWTLDSATSVATFELCGCLNTQNPDDSEYIGFGLSGSTDQTNMDGADVVIAWVDSQTGSANAVDYYLSSRVQCRNGQGVCPDESDSSGACTDDVFGVSGTRSNGQQCIRYSRKLTTMDSRCDSAISTSEPQYVVWGVGGLGETAFKHFKRASASDPPLNLGREPRDQCVGFLQCQSCEPFPSATIEAPKGKTFNVKLGPSGLDRGYSAITGLPGWGISFWIDRVFIPELVLTRGETYTFVVEAGDNLDNSAEYHPFYITDSVSGGRLLNDDTARMEERVFAGFDDNDMPTAVGRLCEYTETVEGERLRVQCGSREDYSDEVLNSLRCVEGNATVLQWTPDNATPDTVYYQCAVHLNLGWKIRVTGTVDPCDLDNGGCPDDRVCQLNKMACDSSPCPPMVECIDPCATHSCNGSSRCRVYPPTREAFCEPTCEIENGGCTDDEFCQLETVQCVRAPCPRAVACLTIADVCNLDGDSGPCDGNEKAFFFDRVRGDCKRFSYGGCEGNHNRFPTIKECRAACSQCILPADSGDCDGAIRSWFFNSESGQCEVFTYGGCGGNVNRFSSSSDCERACGGGDCPPTCSEKFCSRDRNAICSRPGPPSCDSSCQLTHCGACYFSEQEISLPEFPDDCLPARCRGGAIPIASDDLCLRRWGLCVRRAYRQRHGAPASKDDEDYKCYSHHAPS